MQVIETSQSAIIFNRILIVKQDEKNILLTINKDHFEQIKTYLNKFVIDAKDMQLDMKDYNNRTQIKFSSSKLNSDQLVEFLIKSLSVK